MGNSKLINILKERKVLKEFDLLKYKEQSSALNKKILDTRARVALTKTEYKKATDAGLVERARDLSEAVQNMQSVLGSLGKQKKNIDHWVLAHNEELVKLNTEISHEESRHRGLFRLPFLRKEQGKTKAKQETAQETTKKLTPEELDKKFQTAIWENNMKKKLGLQQPQKLSPQDFKKKFNAHLVKDLFKKNSGQSQSKVFAPGELTQKFDQILEDNQTVQQSPAQKSQPTTPSSSSPIKTATASASGALASTAQTAGTIKGIAKTIKNIVQTVKNVIQVIRIATTSATVIGAVANIALLLKKKLKKLLVTIAKIYAAIQALLLLMWLWILAKIAGIIAGVVFGAVSGLPLLLVPGIGPALYAGWVGFWAYKGWTDPLAVIHIATHPWELFTRPLNWIGNQITGWGGTAKGGVDAVAGGVGSATSGAISGVGGFVTGLASSAWGGITAGISAVGGSIGSFAGGFLSNLASAGSAIAGNVIPVAVGGTMASVVGGTLMGTIITNSAFYTQELDAQEKFSAPGVNELFTILKTATPSSINEELGPLDTRPVTFRVTVTSAGGILTNLSISDQLNTTGLTIGTNTCQGPIPAGTTISAGGTWSCELVVNINQQQNNSTVVNTATFTASSEDGSKTETDTATASVRIGSAPAGCPHGWPATGPITQGPDGTTSHGAGTFSPTDPGYEAIDIGKGAVIGDPIYSTIDGTVVNIWQRDSLDQRVEVAPLNCPGLSVVAFWHNSQILVSEGQTVTFGQVIARSGAYTGSSGPAPHLHYQFNLGGSRVFRMEEPYIPYSGFARNCNGNCNYTITNAP